MTTLQALSASAAPDPKSKSLYHELIVTARVTGYIRAITASLALVAEHHGAFSPAYNEILSLMTAASEQSVSPEEFDNRSAS